MGKILYTVLIFRIFECTLNAQTQNLVWVNQVGDSTNNQSYSTTVDNLGNVYYTGSFYNTIDFDPGPQVFNLTSYGYDDIYICKLDVSGNFVWAKQIGGSSYSQAYSIAVDTIGNIYTTGKFFGTCDFDPGPNVYNLVGTNGVFISKLDTSGSFVWAKAFIGSNESDGYAITVDNFGNVYTTGKFAGTHDFDPSSGIYNLTSVGSVWYDVFISKLDSLGNFVWAKQFGGPSAFDLGSSIIIDINGNVYTTGVFSLACDFDPGPDTYILSTPNEGDLSAFISKLDATGNFVWAKMIGGGSSGSSWGNSLKLDGSNNVLSTGFFGSTCDFDPGGGTNNMTSIGNLDVYILKLNTEGNFIWSKQIGGGGDDRGLGIVLDDNGNIFTVGYFNLTADFDPGTNIFNLSSTGGTDIFICQLDSFGQFGWAGRFGGLYNDFVNFGGCIAIGVDGSICTTGAFRDTADFDPSPVTYNLVSEGETDIFILKIGPPCTEINFIDQPISQTTNVCKIATFSVETTGTIPIEYIWHKNGIQIPNANNATYTTPTLTLADNGNTYYCIASNCNGTYLDTSTIAALTVIPPCIFSLPSIALDNSSLIPGEILAITGSNFTSNGTISLTITDESSVDVGAELPITYMNPGMFSFTLPILSSFLDGDYEVHAIDLATGNSAPIKTFRVSNHTPINLQITRPISTETYITSSFLDISWNDFVVSTVTSGLNGYIDKFYNIELSSDNGGTWNSIGTWTVDAVVDQISSHTIQYQINTPGTYIVRISDMMNSSNFDESDPFVISNYTNAGFIPSLVWDKTGPVPSEHPDPIGLAADGTARILVKLTKNQTNTKTVSTINAQIETIGNSYSGTALLGKIIYAATPLTYNIEGNAANSTQYPYTAAGNGNASSYYFWLVAPDNYTNNLQEVSIDRNIKVKFTITYSDGTVDIIYPQNHIIICRPALILVHGFAGSAETFEFARYHSNITGTNLFFDHPNGSEWKVVRRVNLIGNADFETNARILLGRSADNNYSFYNSFQNILYDMRKLGFANNRLDYVCHSMGGCVARTVINDGGTYYIPGIGQFRNYNRGFINKLITINTPHNGSLLADLVIDNYFNLGNYIEIGVARLFNKMARGMFKDNIPSPAAYNMQAYHAGIRFNETFVKNHLIGSDIDKDNYLQEMDILNGYLDPPYKLLFNLLLPKNMDVSSYYYENYQSDEYLLNSDIIVSTSSQMPGRTDIVNLDFDPIQSSTTSIIYGLDKHHISRAKDIKIGSKVKLLLNAQINSNYFSNSIMPNTNPIQYNYGNSGTEYSRTIVPPDTIINYFDSLFIKITNPIPNISLYVDSLLQIVVHVKDTNDFQRLRLIFQSQLFESQAKDSIQTFLCSILSDPLGENSIIAIAEYDSLGVVINHIDTITLFVTTLDSLVGFYVTPESQYINPQQIIEPDYHVIYPTFIGILSPEVDSISHFIMDTNVITYDSVNFHFIAKDTGTTHIIFTYNGMADTTFFYINVPIEENIESICPQGNVSFYAGTNDSTKTYQWQVNPSYGFNNISNNAFYTGTDSSTLTITNAPSSWYGNLYRCVISDSIGSRVSRDFTLRFSLVWTGAIDSTWENPGNWNCNSIPDCNTDVTIPSSMPRYPKVNSFAYCKSIKVDSIASIIVKPGYKLWVGNKSIPTLNCPANIDISLDPGACEAQVGYTVSSGEVCSGTLTQTSGIPSMGYFPVGTTTNCFELTDESGNVIASCCFDVSVSEFPNPTSTPACNDNVQVSINESCEAFVSTDIILEGGPYSCYNDYLVAVEDYGSGLGGVTIYSSAIGQTLNVTVTDPSTGNTCSGTISVEDKIVPLVICSDFETSCSTYIEPDSTNTPIATDNCGGVILTFSDEEAAGSCPGFSTILRHWVVTDSSGNTSTCDQVISFLPASIDSVLCPPNYVGQCNNNNFPYITGYPIYNGEEIDNNGLCNLFAFYTDLDTILDGYFTVLRTWRIVDTCTSIEIECVQNIISNDNEDPILTCSPNFETTCSDPLDPSATGIPEVEDDCYTVLTYQDSIEDGDCIGVFSQIMRTWTAIDENGNSSSCQQLITVLINNSLIICPSDTTLDLESGETQIQVVYSLSTLCNCADTIVQTSGISSGGFFPIGTTVNCFELIDTMGIVVDSCCFNIIVNEYDSTQCLPGGIVFTTQAQLDSFPVNYACTQILGNVTIDDGGTSDITNLNGLSLLTGIGGSLTIQGNNALTSLIGLGAVSFIGGQLTIYDNNTLTNLTGLDSLSSIGGQLYIDNNTLTSLIGLDALTSISGDLSINGNASLTSLDGLGSVTTIGGSLYIDNNSALVNLSGLGALGTIGGFLQIHYNSGLTSLTGLDVLTSIGGYISLFFNPDLTSLTGLNTLTSIAGYLSIYGNNALISLTGLDAIDSINGDLNVNSNNALTNLTGLGSVTSIGGTLNITGNSALTNLSGLDGVTSIGENLSINDNFTLSSLSGLGAIVSIGGNLEFNSNYSLANLSGLGMVTSIGGGLHINYNSTITSLTGLDEVTSIGGSLGINSNSTLSSLSALSMVSSLGGYLSIDNNASLASLAGLENIDYTTITDLIIQSSNVLTTCDVQSICDYLDIPTNPATIFGNATGCATRMEVEDECGN